MLYTHKGSVSSLPIALLPAALLMFFFNVQYLMWRRSAASVYYTGTVARRVCRAC